MSKRLSVASSIGRMMVEEDLPLFLPSNGGATMKVEARQSRKGYGRGDNESGEASI